MGVDVKVVGCGVGKGGVGEEAEGWDDGYFERGVSL